MLINDVVCFIRARILQMYLEACEVKDRKGK